MSKFSDRIKKDLVYRLQNDSQLRSIVKKIRAGDGDYTDAEKYASRAGQLLTEVFQKNITADNFPVGSVKELASMIIPAMETNHDAVTQVTGLVQKSLNKAGNIGMNSVTPSFNKTEAYNLIGRMANYESFEDAEWILGDPVQNAALKISDDTLKSNADFQYKSGLRPKIVRTAESDACDWCVDLEGEYDYEEVRDRSNPVFQRHNNCQCEITYVPGDGRVQDVSSKQWLNEEEKAKRQVWSKSEANEYSAKELIPKTISQNTDYMGMARIEEISLNERDTRNIKVYANDKYKNISCQTYSGDSQKTCEIVNDLVNSSNKYLPVEEIIVVKNKNLGGISSYNHVTNVLYISEELSDPKKFSQIVSSDIFPARDINDVINHELGGHQSHWKAVYSFFEDHRSKYSSIDEAKNALEANLRRYVKESMYYDNNYVGSMVSKNAELGFAKGNLNELIADAKVLMEQGKMRDSTLAKLVDEVLNYDGKANQ